MAVDDVLRLLDQNPVYRSRIVHRAESEPEPAEYGTLDYPLDPSIASYLDQKKIRLYAHQCETINSIRSGKNVIITTPTASGKSLAFNVPVFEQLASDKEMRALYLYPTKALSNDQLATHEQMARFTGINTRPAIYDGDTAQSKRAAIREHSRIIISNPHELHQILSWHAKWSPFFSNLRFIVIDEAHRYRGVLGSHIAFLIRRLLRICRCYGSTPRFILSTATIANPVEFATRLTGRQFEHVKKDGSPHGKKHFVLYNPFFDGIGERSAHQETKDLLISCVKHNLQTLCFAGSRKMAELITVRAREDAKRTSVRLADSISAYRAGFLPEERRDIERRLKDGTMKGVVSTNALELGIDVGSLDAILISGFPGTMMSVRQQAGRAGRNGSESLAIMIAQANPLDQYFMHHPDQFFGRSHENAIVDVANPYIVSGHLLCAAAELPLQEDADREFFSGPLDTLLPELAAGNLLRKTSRGWVYTGRSRASGAVNLGSILSETFRIVCNGRLLETMDRTQAYREAHKGAIMLHQGETYVVNEMDLETHTIRVTPTDVDYYTQPLKEIDLAVIETIEQKVVNGMKCCFGDVEVTERYTGYKIKRGDTIIGLEPLSLPQLTFRTKAFWFNPREESEQNVINAGLDLAGGLHGAEHALIALMPLHVMCDRWDIGGLSSPAYGEDGGPVIFIYDGFEGGIGLSEKAFEILPELFETSRNLVKDCACEKGCPSCIYSPKCGNDNQPLDKNATILLLGEFCGAQNPVPAMPPVESGPAAT